MQSRKEAQSLPSIYDEPIKLLASVMDVSCYCFHCGFSEKIDLLKTDFVSFSDIKSKMQCPDCENYGLSLSINLKSQS